MYTKRNLLVSSVAAKRSVKPELACIAFYGNRTIATDSFRVVEIIAEGEDEILKEPILLNAQEIKQRVVLSNGDEVSIGDLKEVYGLKQVDGVYPEIDKILTSTFANEDIVEIKFCAKLLLETLQVFVRANKNTGVTLRVPTGKSKGMTIEAQGIRAIVMPRLK